jgi:APA family basic amino acid/polyamine antiporter
MEKLRQNLSLFDAINIALGSIIGAGIFVIIGAAAALAGPAIFISVIIAGIISGLTGLSTAELSRRYPRSGGAYTFAKEALSDSVGFVVGWVWLFSNIVTGATVAVGFGYYLAFFIPSISTKIGAVFVIFVATFTHLLGTKESSWLNNVLVMLKILVLLFIIGSAVFFFKKPNFIPLMPFGIKGVLAGAATIFFAYAGFARVAIIADEIKNPSQNVPRATLASIFISTLIYVLVAIAAVGIAGYKVLADSGSPLADAIKVESLSYGSSLVGAGALIATSTVILASILGVSRLAHTMAADGELPAFLGKVSRKSSVPKNSIILSGLVMLLLALFADLPHIAYISSFSLLLYYSAVNLSALKLFRGYIRFVTFLGFLFCMVLMFTLPHLSWFVGFSVVVTGALFYRFYVRKARKSG